jgi:hypothetical protein
VALWRKLRRLGAVQVLDGLVALPLDARTKEQLEWLAEEVLAAGGESSIWLAEASSSGEERALAGRMSAAVAAEYRALIAEAEAEVVGGESTASGGRALRRLRRELRSIRSRDFFPPPEAEEARQAVEALAAEHEGVTSS